MAGSGQESGMWEWCVDRRCRTVDTVSVQDGAGLGYRQGICQGSEWRKLAQEVTRSCAECAERWRVADGAERVQRGRVRRRREDVWEERQGRERAFQE